MRIAGLAALAGSGIIVAALPVGNTVAHASTSLSLAVSGNHFVNGQGQTIRLLGVNVPSTEYACDEGWGYSSLPLDTSTASAIATWHANAVRVPLNEDCWLGLNGEPSFGTEAGYRAAIEGWVSALNAQGLYAILDLHWSAPGSYNADGQRPMPDDHSDAFWSSVASTFLSNPAVVFDAFNEPYSPAADGDSSLAVSWSCWDEGGCLVPVAADGTTPNDNETYQAVGMQSIVDAIRATGASQPIMLGGLSYANDLSGWLANEPTDPDGQLVASFHNYYGEACDTTSCWNDEVAPVADQVPVVTGEFDQGYDCADPPTGPPALTTFDNTYMDWADRVGVSYLAWGWWVLGNTSSTCSSLGGGSDNYALVSTSTGTPVAPDGTDLHSHLASLDGATTTTLTTSFPSGAGYNQAITLTATVMGEDGAEPTGSVTVSSRGSPLCRAVALSDGTAVCALSAGALPIGSDTVTATFTPSTGSGLHASHASLRQVVIGPPVIKAAAPSSGPGAGGTKVVIRGTGLGNAQAVMFGPSAAAVISDSATAITALPPSGTGTVSVVVTTPYGTSSPSESSSFTYLAPSVTSLAPTHGPAGGETKVTVHGKDLQGATSVSFGSLPATGIAVNSPGTALTAYAPTSAAGSDQVTVTTPGGTSQAMAGDVYTYQAPSVTKVTPHEGAAGVNVVITGVDFTGVSQVLFGSTPAAFTLVSATKIEAVVPAGTGEINITVATPQSVSALTTADEFTYS